MYFYLNGAKLAEFPSLQNWYYYYGDHLGTTRMMTDSSGTVCYDADFYPWGNEQNVVTNTCSQNYKFTGKERDPDMHVDYFGARFYEGATGRLYSPDSIMVAPNRLSDPQRLNAYAYVRNNPLSYVDPDGRDADSASEDSGGGAADETNDSTPDSSPADKKGEGSDVLQPLKDAFWGTIDGFLGQTVGPGTPGELNSADLTQSLLIGGMGGEGEIGEVVSAADRATELAGAMGKTKDFVTIAVTETKEGIKVVSSSENALRPAVKSMLSEGEVAAKGAGHAEVTGVKAAKQMGLNPTGVAASRGICPSCAQFLKDVGVAALSAIKGSLY